MQLFASSPPETCRRLNSQRRRTGQTVKLGRLVGTPCLNHLTETGLTTNVSVTTRAAIDRPIALAVSLVGQSDKSVALRISAIPSDFIVSSSSKSSICLQYCHGV